MDKLINLKLLISLVWNLSQRKFREFKYFPNVMNIKRNKKLFFLISY